MDGVEEDELAGGVGEVAEEAEDGEVEGHCRGWYSACGDVASVIRQEVLHCILNV